MRTTAWGFVVRFGIVAMLADVVYEGARSIAGPYLGQLGADAALVGVITGAGEAVAMLLRLFSGPVADRLHRYWTMTVVGYAITVVAVPALALAGTLWVACMLLLLERAGKAVRGPAKDTLLSHAGSQVGQGRAFAVHEVLDQFGALVGPLLVAAAFWLTGGYRAGFALLALPGVAVLVILFGLIRAFPDPGRFEKPEPVAGSGRLPGAYWRYLAFTTLTMFGYATFGLIGFHLAGRHVLPVAAVPLVYAGAMVVDAGAALVTGRLYDRYGLRVMAALPVLAAGVAPLAFSTRPGVAVTGALVWGAAMGIQESTLRGAVADLAPRGRRATAYGVFGAGYGVAWLVGGALLGVLYGRSVGLLVAVVVAIQLAALVLLALTRRTSHPPQDAPTGIRSPGRR